MYQDIYFIHASFGQITSEKNCNLVNVYIEKRKSVHGLIIKNLTNEHKNEAGIMLFFVMK